MPLFPPRHRLFLIMPGKWCLYFLQKNTVIVYFSPDKSCFPKSAKTINVFSFSLDNGCFYFSTKKAVSYFLTDNGSFSVVFKQQVFFSSQAITGWLFLPIQLFTFLSRQTQPFIPSLITSVFYLYWTGLKLFPDSGSFFTCPQPTATSILPVQLLFVYFFHNKYIKTFYTSIPY